MECPKCQHDNEDGRRFCMEKVGWPEAKIHKIMGENWVRVLAEAWGE